MKTTIEIQDDLLERAKRHAKASGCTLRAVVEDGLRLALSRRPVEERYRLPDRRVGNSAAKDPLEAYSWAELRDEIYADSSTWIPDDRR